MRPSTDNPDDAAVGAGLVGRRLTGMERRLPDMANLAISQWSDNRVESEPKKAADPRSAAFPERRVLCLYRFTS
jgi:hypothetical protein